MTAMGVRLSVLGVREGHERDMAGKECEGRFSCADRELLSVVQLSRGMTVSRHLRDSCVVCLGVWSN